MPKRTYGKLAEVRWRTRTNLSPTNPHIGKTVITDVITISEYKRRDWLGFLLSYTRNSIRRVPRFTL